MNYCNLVSLEGVLAERQPVRYTPAGLQVTEAVILHQSEQNEAGQKRRVECEAQMIALGQTAVELSRIETGARLTVRGFLAAKSLRRRQELVLHIEEFELLN